MSIYSVRFGRLGKIRDASTTVPGVVNVGAQTFGGIKTFADAVILSSTLALTSNLTLGATAKIATGGVAAPAEVDAGGVAVDHLTGTKIALRIGSTGSVAHGMTTLYETAAYAALEKVAAATGGLSVTGLTEDIVGLQLRGYGVNVNQVTTTAAVGPLLLSGAKKNGTTVGDMAAADNLFVVANRSTARLILKGDGDLYCESTKRVACGGGGTGVIGGDVGYVTLEINGTLRSLQEVTQGG